MTQTLLDKKITNVWQSINSIYNIAIGTEIEVNNKSNSLMVLAEGDEPDTNSVIGVPLHIYENPRSGKVVQSGSLEIWCRTMLPNTTGSITVQEL